MSLEELYYVSQIVAVIAIFGSLVYVAIQTRQNSRLIRAKAAWDAEVSFIEINDTLASGGAMSELSFKILTKPESLTDYERHLAHRFLRGVLQRTEAQYALYAHGILDKEVWHLRRAYIKGVLKNPVFNEVWRADKANSMFTHAFIAEMDKAEDRDVPTFLGAGANERTGSDPV